VPWGIDLPWDKDQTVYVWVDALLNYITNLNYPDETQKIEMWWRDGAVMQLMAIDILKFHAVYWPAILLALDLPLPKNLYVHGFFTIDGEKMSKSRGNVVSPVDLADHYGAEASRYLILSQFSFGYESDIRVDAFTQKYNSDLADGLGNLVSRTAAMAVKFFDGKLPLQLAPDKKFQASVSEYIEHLRFRDALLLIWERIASADKLIDDSKPWQLVKTDTAGLKKVMSQLCDSVYNIGLALTPFMPSTAATIQAVMAARPVVKPDNLFAKIKED